MIDRRVTLLLFLCLTVGGGLAIGYLTAPGDWYAQLRKPVFNPPGWIFGPVWTVLYVVIGVVGWRLWQRDRGGRPMQLWWLQLVLNFSWTPIFFALHRIDLALAVVEQGRRQTRHRPAGERVRRGAVVDTRGKGARRLDVRAGRQRSAFLDEHGAQRVARIFVARGIEARCIDRGARDVRIDDVRFGATGCDVERCRCCCNVRGASVRTVAIAIAFADTIAVAVGVDGECGGRVALFRACLRGALDLNFSRDARRGNTGGLTFDGLGISRLAQLVALLDVERRCAVV